MPQNVKKKENKRTIKMIPKVDRPREKLIKYGVDKLSSTELLAILLHTGTKKENVIDLASRILKQFGKERLPQASIQELRYMPGVGPVKACDIVASFELARRLIHNKKERLYLTPRMVFEELKDIRDNKKEHFIVFFLDSRHQELKREIISVGSINMSLVHPREVFEPAILHLASQIIVAHNHPSGNSEPSDADMEVTKQLVQAGKILGIEVLDHIIVTQKDYLSFKQQKLLYSLPFI